MAQQSIAGFNSGRETAQCYEAGWDLSQRRRG